jgi:phosphatidylglycerol:prolipoprotein diacylglycerol transferase
MQNGTLFALYLVLAGTERFLVEFIRRNDEVVAGLTLPQLESLAMMIVGSVWLVLAARRRRRAELSVRERPLPDPS